MTSNTERRGARELYALTMAELAGLVDHAAEAGMDDLALYFTMARTELALGPWEAPLVEVVMDGRVGFAEGVGQVLDLIDAIRPLTDEVRGVIALAMTRLWLGDGVAWLDAKAVKVAAACRATTVTGWLS